MKRVKKEGSGIEIEIREEDYEQSLKEGATPDDAMMPGKHRFHRFKDSHPDVNFEESAKVKVTMWLDVDVVEYFTRRAKDQNAAPYQTQINNELRCLMKSDAGIQPDQADFGRLLTNPQFLDAVAERVSQRLKR